MNEDTLIVLVKNYKMKNVLHPQTTNQHNIDFNYTKLNMKA